MHIRASISHSKQEHSSESNPDKHAAQHEDPSSGKPQQNGIMERNYLNSLSILVHKVVAGDEDMDQNYQFYKEYCRLYYANIILTNRLQ